MKTNKNKINVIASYQPNGSLLLSAIHPTENYIVRRVYYGYSKNYSIKNFKNYISNI